MSDPRRSSCAPSGPASKSSSVAASGTARRVPLQAKTCGRSCRATNRWSCAGRPPGARAPVHRHPHRAAASGCSHRRGVLSPAPPPSHAARVRLGVDAGFRKPLHRASRRSSSDRSTSCPVAASRIRLQPEARLGDVLLEHEIPARRCSPPALSEAARIRRCRSRRN